MNDGQRRRAWGVGEYLGLVSDKPKPKIGSRSWWLSVVFVSVCVAAGMAVVVATR